MYERSWESSSCDLSLSKRIPGRTHGKKCQNWQLWINLMKRKRVVFCQTKVIMHSPKQTIWGLIWSEITFENLNYQICKYLQASSRFSGRMPWTISGVDIFAGRIAHCLEICALEIIMLFWNPFTLDIKFSFILPSQPLWNFMLGKWMMSKLD